MGILRPLEEVQAHHVSQCRRSPAGNNLRHSLWIKRNSSWVTKPAPAKNPVIITFIVGLNRGQTGSCDSQLANKAGFGGLNNTQPHVPCSRIWNHANRIWKLQTPLTRFRKLGSPSGGPSFGSGYQTRIKLPSIRLLGIL